jgi:heme A synthase
VKVWRHARSWPALRTLAIIAPVLVLGQIALGIFTVLTWRAVPLAVAHFAGAASLWALWVSAWLLTAKRQETRALETGLARATAISPIRQAASA